MDTAAQIMIISGCDDGTMNMPNYLMNFRFACRLQSQMEQQYPNFTRPILFDCVSVRANFYQQTARCQILIIMPIVTIDGKEAAQIMIFSGFDDGTMNMPNYLMNFRFACNSAVIASPTATTFLLQSVVR